MTTNGYTDALLDGLRARGDDAADLRTTRQAYQAAWAVVGSLMGIDPAVIPRSFADARRLTERIYERQIAPSEEGAELTNAPLLGYQSLVPLPLSAGCRARYSRISNVMRPTIWSLVVTTSIVYLPMRSSGSSLISI